MPALVDALNFWRHGTPSRCPFDGQRCGNNRPGFAESDSSDSCASSDRYYGYSGYRYGRLELSQLHIMAN
eukprot:g24382.t1